MFVVEDYVVGGDWVFVLECCVFVEVDVVGCFVDLCWEVGCEGGGGFLCDGVEVDEFFEDVLIC